MAKKSRLDAVSVPNHCPQDWNEMHGGAKFRFCGVCEKNVYNISAMSVREADKLLFETAEKVCIRMEKDAHGKIKTLRNQLHHITRQAPIAAGVLSATLAFSAVTLAQGQPFIPPSGKSDITLKAKDSSAKPTISGKIADESGAIIPNVKIILRGVKNGAVQNGISNEEGFYQFSNIESKVYEIRIEEDRGFKSFTVRNIEVSGKNDLQVNITLIAISPTTLGVSAETAEMKLPSAKVENKINHIQTEKPLSAKSSFVLGKEARLSGKTSQISLTISDVTDAIIPGAEILLTNQKTKQQFSAVSNEDGIVYFSYLSPGKYQLRISANGFQSKTVSLKLKDGIKSKERINLEVGATMGTLVIVEP